MGEARKEFEEALQFWRGQPAQRNLEAFQLFIAQTFSNLGNLDSKQNRPDDARKEYQEALQFFRGQAKKNPETRLPISGTSR